MSFVTPTDGIPAVAEHVAQLTENLSGIRNIPVTLTNTLTVPTVKGSSTLVLDTTGGSSVLVNLTGSTMWEFNPSGHFLPWTTNVSDIGSGTYKPRSLHLGTSATIAGKTVGVSATGGNVLTWNSDGYYVPTPAAGLTLPLTQHLTFSPDNTYDIGASGATRPRRLYAGTGITTPNISADLSMTITTGSAITITPNNYINMVGHILYLTSNTYDIGGVSNTPRDLWVGRNLTMTGSNARFIADWTSASQAALQTSQVNGSTQFYTIPNGTSRQSGFYAWGDSVLTNAQYFGFIMDSANNAAKMTVGRQGTGGYANMIMSLGGSDKAYFWASGKVELLTGPLEVNNGGVTVKTGNIGITAGGLILAGNQSVIWTDINSKIYSDTSRITYFDEWAGWNWRSTQHASAVRMYVDNLGNVTHAGTMTVSGPVTGAAYNTIAFGNEVGQGNGVQSTGPLIKGSGFGPTQAAGAGWLRFMTNNTPIFIAYYV